MYHLALPLVLGVLGAPGQTTEISFSPEVGTRLAKTILVRNEMNLDEMGTSVEGNPLSREDIGGWVSSGTRQKMVDEYLAVEEGRPTRFRRTITNFEGNARMTMSGSRGTQEHKVRFESPLAGFPVMHTWIPEEQTWGRCYDYLAYEEEQLEQLQDDADFLGLLPAGPVEPGASWDVPAEALRSLFTPGGNSAAAPADEGYFARMVEVGIGGDLADVLGDELSGVATATFKEVREAEGRQVAVLSIEFSLASDRDRTRTYLVGMPKEEKRESTQLNQVLLTWIAEGTAEVLWDLEAGHAQSATVRGRQVLNAEVFKLSAAETGQPQNVSQRTTYSGTLEIDHKIKEAAEHDIMDPRAAAEAANKGKKKKKKGKGKAKQQSDG